MIIAVVSNKSCLAMHWWLLIWSLLAAKSLHVN